MNPIFGASSPRHLTSIHVNLSLLVTAHPGKVFYFLHIPKTAGTTVCFSVLSQLFTEAETCPAHDYPELLSIPAGKLAKYRLFRGHFYYFVQRLLPVKPRYFTFLRNPIERTISLWDHLREDTEHYSYPAACSLTHGLDEAVHCPRLLPPNFQVTALACDLNPVQVMEEARFACPSSLDESSVIYTEMIKRAPTCADLKKAMRRLEGMEFFGIAEHFDESIELLCSTFGWTPPSSYRSLKITSNRTSREQIAPDTLRELAQSHELDFELYDFARSLFSQRMAASNRHKHYSLT